MNHFIKSSFFHLLVVLLLSSTALAQTTGIIQGVVYTSEGDPAEYVNVSIEGTSIGAVADRFGKFKILHVPAGTYTLVASFIGLESKRQTVEVKTDETVTLDFKLNESRQQLKEVIISSNRLHTESVYVSKMPLKNIENPQVYTTVSADLLKQQAVVNYDDALKNVPGIYKRWESTGRGSGDGTSFFSLRGFESQATMVNGLPGLTNGSLDPANIEKIEVIKGPSGTLFGSSLISYGGLINTVTKKPYSSFGGELSYTAGSFGLNRVTADINSPLPTNKDVALRLVTAYHSENSFQDAGFRKSFFIAPSFSYKVNDKLSFLISSEIMQEEKTNPTMIFLGRATPLQYAKLSDLNYNNNLSLTSNDLSIKNPRFNLQVQMNSKLSEKWTSQTVLSRGVAQSDGYYSYLYDSENGQKQFRLLISKQQGQTETTDIQQNFIGDFSIGTMRNRLVVGLDYFHLNLINNGSGYAWIQNVDLQGNVNFISPATGESVAPRFLTRASVDNVLASSGASKSNSKNAIYSAYFSDVINITPSLLAMASLRLDYFKTEGDIATDGDDYNQTALSPKFGLLYQVLNDKLSVFANYMNGFRNVAPTSVADANGSNPRIKTFEPEHANQMEFGVKSNLFSERLSATASYYDIKVANVVTPDPQNPNNSLQGGEVESKGFELELTASLAKGLSIISGFSHNDTKITKGEVDSPFNETGTRPVSSGPANLVNFWATYTFQETVLNGFGVGFGGNYSSELLVLNGTTTGTFNLPSYTVLNGSIFYNTNVFRIALNVNNLTDKEYYTGYSTINPQKPRNIVASFSYKF